MQVSAIDHVNVLTDDLDKTANFYADVLGLKRGESVGAAMGYKGAWMFDDAGFPIVHIGLKTPERDYGPDHIVGAPTGALHHVAFRCSGFESAKERLAGLGLAFNAMERPEVTFRQITLKDPNNINLELNFANG